ncbi:Serine carboxypeptidase S28 [Geosmithia morbida]|uniref:Serine carboxypeptidase S28 n=1 Tax=Geosmithia morbida TaxID=1094350 RepID=A0A9P4Z2J7_9HYPO|nr:Serine carboxypeptidase S28 [Geosmithia morbida]KAF4126262.1 Serine carboxypeptidase S28 [Geosmithia morbida]
MKLSVIATLAGLLASTAAFRGLPIPIGELSRQQQPAAIQSSLSASYPEYNLSIPIDHFLNESIYEPHSRNKFNLRYWFDAQFYKPGGPIFVLCGGETDAQDRLPFLQKGIVHEIAKATNGVGVILEHRYYGKSIPTPDFSTENLRFLTTEQALADTAYFAKHVKFQGLEGFDLTPEKTPWLAYGGSYAGSFAAFLRVVYPDTFFGAISSSGVPAAIWDYWEYYEAARIFGPPVCSRTQGKLTNIVDNILLNETNADYVVDLKTAFGIDAKIDNADFVSAITGGITSLQSYNWDPEVSSDAFFTYCDTISNDENQFPALESNRPFVEKIVAQTGYADDPDPLVDRMLNYIGTQRSGSGSDSGSAEISDKSFYDQDDLSQTWRLWPYQVCTEDAFNITKPADTDRINKYGSFNISYPRLAFVDGQWDPWRAAGVHALSQVQRDSTISEPMILIDGGVHHWDENGVFPNETKPGFPPKAVIMAKREMRDFVKEWLGDWV